MDPLVARQYRFVAGALALALALTLATLSAIAAPANHHVVLGDRYVSLA